MGTPRTFAEARATLAPLPGAPPEAGLFLPDDARSIAGTLPAALAAVGAAVPPGRAPLPVENPPRAADRLLFVFVDSLGLDLLLDPATSAGPLRLLFAERGTAASSVLPSITPVAATSIYTGLLPRAHGIEAHKMRIEAGGPVVDVLKMEEAETREAAPDALVERLAAEVAPKNLLALTDVPSTALIPSAFVRSGLSRAIFPPGLRVEGFSTILDGLAKARALLEAHRRSALVLYVFQLDETAHLFAPRSPEGRHILAHVERTVALALRRLDPGVRSGTLVALASDHGQAPYGAGEVEVTFEARGRLGRAGVEALGTSGRFLHAYLAAGADRAAARAALAETLGPAVPILDGAGGRAGDLLAPMPDGVRLHVERAHHRGERREHLTEEVASHGSLTAEELLVPFVLATADEYLRAAEEAG